jgi:cytoskeletal protein RodZ
MNTTEEITKLKDLLDSGAISAEEYEKQKAKLFNAESSVQASQAVAPPKKKKKKVGLIVLIVIVVLIIIIAVANSGGGSDNNTATEKPATNTTEDADTSSAPEEETTAEEPAPAEESTPKEESADDDGKFDESEYKEIQYDDLLRTPDEYVDQKIKMSGYAVQSAFTAADGVFEVIISLDEYGEQLADVAWQSDVTDKRVLEGDSITVYGTYVGTSEYTASDNSLKVVPGIHVTKLVID